MMPLRANLTCQPQSVYHGLLLLLDLSLSHPPFETHLQIVAENLQYLLVCHLETEVFVGLFVQAGFALYYQNLLFISEHDGVGEVLLVLESVLAVLRLAEAGLAHLPLRQRVDPLPLLQRQLLGVQTAAAPSGPSFPQGPLQLGLQNEDCAVLTSYQYL
jgi:hypothetical protein